MIPVDCTQAIYSAPSDSGIAGTGVLLSFITTAGLALLLSSSITVRHLLDRNAKNTYLTKVLGRILVSFSDQQIVTGIGIQSLALAKINTIIPTHFFIVWMLGLLSTATHLSTLLALVGDFQRDWVMRWLRQGFMFINLALSSSLGVLMFMASWKDTPPTVPMICAWSSPGTGTAAPNVGISIAGTIAVMTVNAVVFALGTWYLHGQRKWLRAIQGGCLIVIMAVSVGAASRIIVVSSAFNNASAILSDQTDKQWSFCQLLPLLLLWLPIISAVEVLRGDVIVPAPVEVSEKEKMVDDASSTDETAEEKV